MGDDSEWMKLPTEQKVEHKVWKARVSGYEELTKTFKMCMDEKSSEFTKYQGLIKKFATDSNAIAQEKALDCVLAFLEKASSAHIGRIASDVCSGIITKCLNASRTKTKEKAGEALMLIIEAEKADIVQEELLKGLGNKQPKVVIGCVQSLREGLVAFGTKVLPAKPMMKMVPKLLEDRDKNVREETKQLVIEVYRWVGPAIKPILSGLKPVQLTELDAEFESLPGGTPKQTRFLRSQQDLKEKMEAAAEAGEDEEGEEEDEEPAEDLDPFEMLTAVDILAKLPKNYYDQVEAKKWQDRREMLEAVQKLTENPKLEKGDYHDLVKTLRKVVAKDTNVMLVCIAAKCMTGLSKGLRKNFSSHGAGCVDTLLEKFREKKITVVTALREAVDATYLTTTLEAVSECCVEYLNHKTPSVKCETAAFLARCFCRCTPATLPKKMLKMFIAPLLKTVNEPYPEVREASYQALGTAMKVVSEKHVLPFLADVDQLKMAKIKECCEKAELIGKTGKPVAKKAESKEAPAKAASAPKAIRGGPPKAGAPKGGPPRESASAAGAGPSRPNTALSKKKGAAGAKKGKTGGAAEECTEQVLSDEAVDEKAATVLPAETLTGLVSSNWKERLAAMENFASVMRRLPREEIPCQVCVRTLCKKPGLKDNNFQVMKLKVELITFLASNSKFTVRSLEACVNDLVDKIGDVKNGAAVHEALSCMGEACTLEAVSSKVISYAFEQKNPKNQSESLTWLANAIREFGLKVNVKPLIATIKKAFGATNPAVRTAAISVVGVFHLYMGATARVFFEDEKPALLQQIDAEIQKNAGEKPPAPTRGAKSRAAGAESGEDEAEEEGEDNQDGGGVNVADLVPRNDISEKITFGLIEELNDKNWKVRNEALQKVTSILNEAKFITPSLGDLPGVLNTRLTKDANKVLVQATLTICNTLATAMGPSIKKHVSVLGPGILQNCGDSKPQIRQAAVTTLNAWVEQGGFAPFLEGELLADVLKAENPLLRAELYGWAAEKLPGLKKLPAELAQVIPLLYAAQEDRKPEVRQKAQEATLAFMIHLGYDRMFKMAGKVKAGSKEQVLQQLEKARANLPAKPVKAKPAKSAAAAAPATTAAPVEEEEEEEEPAAKAEPVAANNKKAGGAKKVVGGKKAAPAASTATKKKKVEDDEDTGPLLKVNKEKDKRFKDEKTLKTLKWNFGNPQPEFVNQLKMQMEPNVSKTLMEQLFHNDFKQHIKALDALDKEVREGSMESTIANLDLILKWLSLRFFDTNTTVLLKILEYLQNVFGNLSQQDYHLHEQEAYAFVPYLVNKVGDPKDNVRKDIRALFKQMCLIYPASKMFSYVIDGLKSKNTKTKTECLEELGGLIEIYGITVCQPSPAQALKLVAAQIGLRDNSVRSAALNTCVTAYATLGETIYKYVGKLNDKDMGMLEERIKRTGKTKPASAPPSTKTSPDEKPKVARVLPSQHRAPSAEGRRIPKPSSRRDFALEIEEDASLMEGSIPQLIQHEDLDEFNDPIKLPETRVRPPSPSMKLLSGSSEAQTAINLVISEIASTDVQASVRALAQVDAVLMDPERCEALVDHADQMVVMFSMKLRMTYSRHLSPTDPAGLKDAFRTYRSILATLVSMFNCATVAKEISTDIIKDLVNQLSLIMLDPRLDDIEEGPQIVKSVNILLVKIVEKASLSNIMCALLRMLHNSVAADTNGPKYQEVVMKCLWKICRTLPEKISDLDVDKVFGDIHLFMKAYPSHTWPERPSDVPLRTVKTIVHSITKLKGNKVLEHLTLVERSNSELENYIKKLLKSSKMVFTSMNNQNDHMNGNTNENDPVELRTAKKDPSGSNKRLSKSSHDMLAEVFRKIGSKENTREGLNDLYDFKLKYPDANLEPFLKKSSQYFQNYIERGLKNISTEREAKMKTSNESAMSNSSSTTSVSSGLSLTGANTDDVTPSVYMERLKILREKCGLDNNNIAEQRPGTAPASSGGPVAAAAGDKPSFSLLGLTAKTGENGSNSSLSSSSSTGLPQLGSSLSKSTSKEDTSENAKSSGASATTNLVDLKRRLEKIKLQQK